MPDYTRVLQPMGQTTKAVWMADGMEWIVPLPPVVVVDKDVDERAKTGQSCQLVKRERDGKPVILKVVNHANRGRWLSIFHGKVQVLELNHFKREFWDSAVQEMIVIVEKYSSGELDKAACTERKTNWLKGKCRTPIKRKKPIGDELSGTKERSAKPPVTTFGAKNPMKAAKTPMKAAKKANAKSKASPKASSKSKAKAKAKPRPRCKKKADDDEDDDDDEEPHSDLKDADEPDDDQEEDEDEMNPKDEEDDESDTVEAMSQAEGGPARDAPAGHEAPAPAPEGEPPAEDEAGAPAEEAPADEAPAASQAAAGGGVAPKGKPAAVEKATCKRPAAAPSSRAAKKLASSVAASTPVPAEDEDSADDEQTTSDAEKKKKQKKLKRRDSNPSSSQSPPSPRFRPMASHGFFSAGLFQ